jgi:hypothetical protein
MSWIEKIREKPAQRSARFIHSARARRLTILERLGLLHDPRPESHVEHALKVFFKVGVIHVDVRASRLHKMSSCRGCSTTDTHLELDVVSGKRKVKRQVMQLGASHCEPGELVSTGRSGLGAGQHSPFHTYQSITHQFESLDLLPGIEVRL